MATHGYSETFRGVSEHVRFAPDCRHSNSDVGFRSDYDRLALKSRRSGQGRGRSEFDPEETSGRFRNPKCHHNRT